MTREEYEKLLQSDYWKGYSYSLIKDTAVQRKILRNILN